MKHKPFKPDASQREVASRTAFYLLGSIVQRAAQLLLVPFLVAALSPDEFTRFGLMISAVTVLTPLFSLNIHMAPGRLYFDYNEPSEQSDLLFSCISGSLCLTVMGLIVVIGVLRISGVHEPVSNGYLETQVGIALIIMLTVLWEFGTMTMRVWGKAAFFTLASIVHSFGILGAFLSLGPFLQNGFRRGVMAVLFGIGAGGAVALARVFQFVRHGKLRRTMLSKSVAYTWPMVVHLLALWAVGNSGRWIGTMYMELEELAAYTLVTLIVMSMTLISRALFQALLPDIRRSFAGQEYHRGTRIIHFAMVGSIMILAAVYVGLYVAVFAWRLPLPAKFSPTPLLLIMAGIANVCDVLFMRGAWILTSLKKTGKMALATMFSAAVTIGLSFLLVKALGDLGLVIAVAGGYGLQALVSNAAAWWQLRIAYESKAT